MGEFPEPAIRGSPAPVSLDIATVTHVPDQPVQSVDPDPETGSSTVSEDKGLTSEVPLPPPLATRSATSTTRAGRTTHSTTQSEFSVTSLQSGTQTSAQSTTSTWPTTTVVPRTSSSHSIIPSLAPTTIVDTTPRSKTTAGSSTRIDTDSQFVSVSTFVTRPIITPSSISTFVPTPETLATHSNLSFGAIVGVVAAALVVIAICGTCIIFGPRRILASLRGSAKIESMDYEEREEAHRNGATWNDGRPASLGASNDWWRPPAGTLANRRSAVSMVGPGMAGVGAGGGMELTEQAPVQRRASQYQAEEQRTLRSGWFQAGMVRGASLLSLGSLVRPENESVAGMGRLGSGGSAGKRFQELYRRDRAQQHAIPVEPRVYLPAQATVSEMGERRITERRSRVVPKVRRPSRLAESYIPEDGDRGTTHPSLSSVSNITHESAGRGYDADAEPGALRARVF